MARSIATSLSTEQLQAWAIANKRIVVLPDGSDFDGAAAAKTAASTRARKYTLLREAVKGEAQQAAPVKPVVSVPAVPDAALAQRLTELENLVVEQAKALETALAELRGRIEEPRAVTETEHEVVEFDTLGRIKRMVSRPKQPH
jgi:phospholipase/lecithinase/hemolysin